MFFWIVGLYFLLTCFAAWLLLFPSGRDLVILTFANFWGKVNQNLLRLDLSVARQKKYLKQYIFVAWQERVKEIRQHYLLLVACSAIVFFPVLISVYFSVNNRLAGFDSEVRDVNLQVAELLKGEQLVAPLPLPPMVFSTQEVLLERPMLVSASRNWDLLALDFKQRLLLAFKIMQEKHGYQMAIIEGYRSPDRQNMLAELGSHVTNVKAFQSYHQFGMAADCAFFRDGKLVISEKDSWAMKGYALYGEVAESVGLTWGGRWKMMDFGHVELRRLDVLKNNH
ncbi:M15 family metallopeptidase [soil metagenome]